MATGTQALKTLMEKYKTHGCTLTDLINNKTRSTSVVPSADLSAGTPEEDEACFGTGENYDANLVEYLATVGRYGNIVPFRLELNSIENEEAVDVKMLSSEFAQAVKNNAIPGVTDPLRLFNELSHHHHFVSPVAVRILLRSLEKLK